MAENIVVVQGNRTGITITDYRDLMRELRKVDSAYASTLKRNFKAIAQPMRKAIVGTIPKTAPTSGIHIRDPKKVVSGFKPVVVPGRLTWGSNSQNNNVKPNHVAIENTKQKSFRKVKQFGQLSISRVVVDNAAVVMADMAGRSGKFINKRPMTRPYRYGGGGAQTGKYGTKAQMVTMRQHRVNGQGVGMIKALNRANGVQQGKASRWVWPTAVKYSPDVQVKVGALLNNANAYLNERLKTR